MSSAQGFDSGLHAAQRFRAFRRWALLAVGLAFFAEFYGVPYLRMSYTERSGQIVSAHYWSLSGSRALNAGNMPLIVLLPLERSLLSYASESLKGIGES